MKKIIAILMGVMAFANVQAEPAVPLHVLTAASHSTKPLAQLYHSCSYYGINLNVLGVGLPYKGNGQKLTYIQQYLENVPDNEILLFVDAYDCLVLEDAETIVDKFLLKNAECVISAEACFCPASHMHLKDRFSPSPTRFKYLNSGSIIGYAGYLKKVLAAIAPIDESRSDQGQLIAYYVDHQDEIVLDYNADLFLTLQNVDGHELLIDRDNKLVKCLFTGARSSVVHGNGDGKGMYQAIYDILFGQ